MKKIIIFILLLLPVALKAQSINVDSLVNVLNTQKLTDEEKIDLYWDIGRSYVNSNYDKCIEYSNKGLSLAEKRNNKRRISTFNNLLGISYYQKSSFDTSYIYLNKYLETAIGLKDKELEEGAYAGIANMYKLKEDYQTAVDYYMKSLKVRDTISRSQAATLVNLGTVHRALHHWNRAEEYLEQALIIAKQLQLDEIEMTASHALGTVYSDKKERDKAIVFFEKSLELSRKINNIQFEFISLISLGTSYSAAGKHELALQYGHEALSIAEKFDITSFRKSSQLALAEIYRRQKHYKESEEMASRVWAIDSTSFEEATFAALNLAIANIHLGNKQKAEDFIWQYKDIVYKGNDKQMNESLANMEVKYETEKKEMRISILEEEKKLYIWLGIAIAVASFSIIGLLFYRHRLTAQKKKLSEQKIIQLEQEKEFVAIQSSLKAEKAERDLIAHDLHDSVSSLLTITKNNMSLYSASKYKESHYFNNAFEVLSRSITELRRVVYHLKSFILTKEGLAAALDDFCRFIPNAEFHFNGINRRFDSDKEYVLYDCACELINNALKHSDASRIDVHLSMDEQTVYLLVADDGKGFDSQKIKSGIGLDNIRSNISAFGGHLDILSEPDKGTEANIEMEI